MRNDKKYRRGFLKGVFAAFSSVVFEETNARAGLKASPINNNPIGLDHSTYSSLLALKAADVHRLSYNLVGISIHGKFNYETANAPYIADDVDVIKLDSTDLSVGALVRQEQLPDFVTVEKYKTAIDSSDSTAIQLAANAARGKTLVFAAREYVLGSTVTISGALPMHVIGNGATIKGNGIRLAGGYFDVSNSTGVTFEGLKFDMLQDVLPVYTQADYGVLYNTAIKANSGWSDLTVRDCEFVNLHSNAVFCHQGTGFTVTNCIFRSRAQAQTLNGALGAQDLSHIFMLTVGGRKVIAHNQFLNEAITGPANGVNSVYMSGMLGTTLIDSNYSIYAGRDNAGTHRLADYDIYGDAVNVFIIRNVSEHLMGQFMRVSSTKACSIKDNIISVDRNSEFDATTISLEGVSFFGGQKGTDGIEISGNRFTDLSFRHAATIAVIGYDYDYPSLNVNVHNNLFIGGRQDFSLSGPFENVRYENNNSRKGRSNVFVKESSNLIGEEGDGVYDGLYINGNVALNDAIDSSGITVAFGSLTPSKIGYIEIIGNNIASTPASSGQGIVSLMYSAIPANSICRVENNLVDNYNFSYCIRDGGHFIVENNVSRNAGTLPFLDGAGQLSLSRNRNRWGSGKMSGKATLFGGTVTIATDEIRTGDLVQISRLSNSASPGHLRLGAITNETSFVIDSSNSRDAGEVLWKIIH